MSLSAISKTTRLLLLGGVIGPPLFVVVALIEGATRPGYSAWRHFVSQLSLSNQGWMQIANFIVCGVLCLGFALGLRRALEPGRGATWGPILLGVYGLGLVTAGIFVTDPAMGYPPDAQYRHQTTHGMIHGLSGLLVFSSLAAAAFVLASRFSREPNGRGWAIFSAITGALVALSFITSTVSSVLAETGAVPGSPTGVLQRIGIIAGWGWVALLALHVLRTAPRAEVASVPGSSGRAGSMSGARTGEQR
ncbi:MAG: hypothetical protein PVSMB4_17230 [Ktedonobacterales bacterium]